MSNPNGRRNAGANDSLTGNEDFGNPKTNEQKLETRPPRRDGQPHDLDDLEDNDLEDNDLDDIDATGLAGLGGFDPSQFPDLTAQAEELMGKLARSEELERELSETKTKLLRLHADFENYRRRTSEDVLEAKGRGEATALETLLPVLDDLTRAIDSGVRDPATLLPGLKSVRENFLKSLERFGVSEVPGKGADFDPNVHEALSMVPGPEDDKVVEVYQSGFTLRGKLVRPARVVVSRK